MMRSVLAQKWELVPTKSMLGSCRLEGLMIYKYKIRGGGTSLLIMAKGKGRKVSNMKVGVVA